ncbi:unnamed protein product [Caenorhabditis angaria]|uniref:G-protein coupled receptors family 1 profile domain-containing protein n=1 Tax=Caenorhabditis angaria TaxID=860376 RepID=A0A9P1IN71_9PELO|nr:unnamed protein product [Caenorhabditis angaria]
MKSNDFRRKPLKIRMRNFSLEDEKYWIQPSRCCSVDMSSREMINKLNEMEQEEKLFITYDVIERNPKFATVGGSIFEFINLTLKPVLKCHLSQIKDIAMLHLITSAFFKRSDLLEIWSECEHPMFAGLLVVYISNRMRKLFLEQHEPVLAEAFEKIQDAFDDECTSLLDQCFHSSERDTRAILDTNYHLFIHSDGCPASGEDMELMDLAARAKAKNFLAHPACQREIDFRWQPGFKLGQLSFCLFFLFPPLFFLRGRQRIKKREIKTMVLNLNQDGYMMAVTRSTFLIRVYNFYTSPNSKYVIHTLFRMFYVGFYAYVLMTMTRKTMVMNELHEFWDEMIIFVWQCAYLTEMAVLVYKNGFHPWAQNNTADLYRNYLVALTLIAWSVAVISPPSWPIRAFAIIAADLFFYFSFVFATLRLMKIANVDAFFGSIVLMIKKMIPIMVKFMFVFMVFWFTYAVCHISLAGHLKSTPNITDVVWPWLIFSSGAFEIFGEADDEDKLGQVQKCTNAPLNWDVLTDSSVQCWFKTSMIPIFLFCYMLISSVLLVNLVTALLSKKYDDIDKVSHIYWKYKLYSRLIEYEEKLWIPAPLSLIFYSLKLSTRFATKVPIFRIFARIIIRILKCFEGHNYAKDRREERKTEAKFRNDLEYDEDMPTDVDRKGVELVKKQMELMEATRKRQKFETATIRQRFEDILSEFENNFDDRERLSGRKICKLIFFALHNSSRKITEYSHFFQRNFMACLKKELLLFFKDPLSRFLWQYIFPIQFILGVLGNSLILWVLASDEVPNIASDMLAAVSFCDLSFLFIMLPHFLSSFDTFAYDSGFRYFYFNVKVHLEALANWMSAAAIWLILAVSIERYLIIRSPLRAKLYWKRARMVIVLSTIFVTTGLLTMYHYFEFDCVITEFCNGTQLYHYCSYSGERHAATYKKDVYVTPSEIEKWILMFSMFANAVFVVCLPIVFVIILNILMIQQLHKNWTSPRIESLRGTINRTQSRQRQRVTVTVIAIGLCFSLTQGPSAFIVLINRFELSETHFLYTNITNSLVITGKTINFILFCLSSTHFRRKCFVLIYRKFPKLFENEFGQNLLDHQRCNSVDRSASLRTLRTSTSNNPAPQPLLSSESPESCAKCSTTRKKPTRSISETSRPPNYRNRQDSQISDG